MKMVNLVTTSLEDALKEFELIKDNCERCGDITYEHIKTDDGCFFKCESCRDD